MKFTSELQDATCQWDHTVLSATRQRWLPCLHPNWAGWYSIYRPRKDERLSWPGAEYLPEGSLEQNISQRGVWGRISPRGASGAEYLPEGRLGQNISQRGVWSRISPRGASGQNLNVATESRYKFLTVFHSYYWSNLLSFQDTTTGQ